MVDQSRFKYTTIAHGLHRYCSPLSAIKASRLLEAMDLAEGALVLDAGCGKAALLQELLARKPVRGLGLDINQAFLDAGREAWNALHPGDSRLVLAYESVETHVPLDGGYDAIPCLGASQSFGGNLACLEKSRSWLKERGRLLLGEGYWKREPADAYLSALGATRDEMGSHAENAARAVEFGFNVLLTSTSSDDEWDAYEGLYCRAMVEYVRAHPDDPDAAAFAQRAQDWHRTYLLWGRETLGFGFYLLARR